MTRTGGNLTLTGDLLGTYRYMSPEQAIGKRGVDHRTDIYSLGITLYELLTLRPAFDGHDRQELLQKIYESYPVAPRGLNASIPRDLETIVLKATSKEVDGRYDTAQELAQDLRRFLEHRPIRARRATSTERLWRWTKRNRVVAALGAVVTSLLLVMAIGGLLAAVNQAKLLKRQLQTTEELEEHQRRLRRQLYDTQMTVAHEALEASEFERIRELLVQQIPQGADGDDSRGFEWYYLWRRCQRSWAAPNIKWWISIYRVVYSPDGRHVAFGTWDGAVALADPTTRNISLLGRATGGEAIKGTKARAHRNIVEALAFSPDSRLLASGSIDKTFKLWDTQNDQLLSTLGPFEKEVHSLAFSPDGRLLATGFARIREEGNCSF